MEKNAHSPCPQYGLNNVVAWLKKTCQRGFKADDGVGGGGLGQQGVLCKQMSLQVTRKVLHIAAKVRADIEPVARKKTHTPKAKQHIACDNGQKGQIP